MYRDVSQKSWDCLLAQSALEWRPPHTVRVPIQPYHSDCLIHVHPSLTVCRLRVQRRPQKNRTGMEADGQREVFALQFGLGKLPFVPDFRATKLSLHESGAPTVRAEHFVGGWDLLHEVEYVCAPLNGSRQAILWVRCSVRNDSQAAQTAVVRANVGVYREVDLFDYHYVPFYWDASKWIPCERIRLRDEMIQRDGEPIGRVLSGEFEHEWEWSHAEDPREYAWHWAIPFIHPSRALTDIRNGIRFEAPLEPGERRSFMLAFLTDYERATDADREALAETTLERSQEAALGHFRLPFADDKAELTCEAGRLGRILVAMQTSILQLLIEFEGHDWLVPTQGGSSERHYVWVWEAACMLAPMLRLGHFEPVRRALDFIFSLQDSGYKPEGHFTTTEGAIGTTGPRWANSTGAAIGLAADYWLYSREQSFLEAYLPRLLRAADWLVGEIRATRRLDPDGSRPPTYGLMPLACATDGDVGYVVAFTDAYTFLGLEKLTRLLEAVGHERAAGYRTEVEQYRADIGQAVLTMTRDDGFIDRKIVTGEQGEVVYGKFDIVCGAIHLAHCGLLDTRSEAFSRYASYVEERIADAYFLGRMDHDIMYTGIGEWAWQEAWLEAGEWKKAFMAMQTNLRYGMSQDCFQVQERFSKADPAFTPWQPNGSGSGRIIDMILNAFVFERPETVTLLGGIPFQWLRWNGVTELRGICTPHGRYSLEARMESERTCRLRLWANGDAKLPERIRLPEHLEVISPAAAGAVYDGQVLKVTPGTRVIEVVVSGEQ